MSDVMRTEAITKFLLANTHADLASLYTPAMECQVNVARDNGEKTDGQYQGREFVSWTDGLQTWKAFRIPYNAATEPTYEDKPLRFSLDMHADGIGMTGWDWQNKLSRFVAYDFDSIVGHAEGHTKKLSPSELDRLKEAVTEIPWVTLRKSTGGNGLHLYVLLKPVATKNHTEHAALARSILHMLSGLTGYEFASKVDVCGGNMWVWHRKLLKSGGEGLKLLKQGGTLEDVPPNWMEHTRVVTGRASRVHLQQISSEPNSLVASSEEEMFDQLTNQRSKIPLDVEHKKFITWLAENGACWYWDNNMWMLVTHTTHIADAHKALNMRGVFKTIAQGRDKGIDHNCFAYPLRNGGWVIRRYSRGADEADTWQKDGTNFSRCFLNREMDVPTACKIAGGVEHPKGGYCFGHIDHLKKALTDLRLEGDVPPFIKGERQSILKLGKADGKIIVEIDVDVNDPKTPVAGWILDKKKHWLRVYNVQSNATPDEIEKNENYDDIVRHLVSEDAMDRGWMIKGQDSTWRDEPLAHVKLALGAQSFNAGEINEIVGIQVIQAWKLVNRPFEPEYPGNREWNRNAAQLAFIPSRYSDALAFPTWQLLLEHLGSGLDETIAGHEWCQKNNVLNGSDYLKLWVASCIKAPTRPLPYLFFWSTEQNTGKSSFHSALSLLFTRGCIDANSALTADFNGEIENAVICYIEEKDLSKGRNAVYNKIKDWVTSPRMLIHPKHVTPYMKTNTTHWIQCSNDPKFCPVFPGDTRITMVNVPVISPENIIPPPELEKRLKQEAPDFLAYLLRMEIPPSQDRLNVPYITTSDKSAMAEKNKTPLEQFLDEKCFSVMGHVITFAEFYNAFIEYLDIEDRASWTKIRVGKELPLNYPKGRLTTNPQVHVANMAFEQKDAVGIPWTVDAKGFLRQLTAHGVPIHSAPAIESVGGDVDLKV